MQREKVTIGINPYYFVIYATLFASVFPPRSFSPLAFRLFSDRHILNYLRNEKLICSDETLVSLREQLVAEAKFYHLEGLISQLCPQPKVFKESSIITSFDDENTLLSWMSDEPSDAKWGILYKATRDGFKPANFHKRCDGKSPTLVVIKSGENIFGGYARKPWSSRK